ncbi:MAG: hypothetical protein HN731_15085 [Rhodospirillaceae bacterium]|jgi:hypothetical protein|nr:hypothetical protein [Rhodospirillaceae bacterium]
MAEIIEKDAETFLQLLSERVAELAVLSEVPKQIKESINFEDYQEFRNMMGECLSFLIIIERRIQLNETAKKEKLEEQYEELTVLIWSVLLDGSLNYLSVISEKEFLPIGTRYVFVQELKTLYDAENILKQEKFEHRLNNTVLNKRDKAERILETIIDRAPQLLNMTG